MAKKFTAKYEVGQQVALPPMVSAEARGDGSYSVSFQMVLTGDETCQFAHAVKRLLDEWKKPENCA